MEPSQAAGKSSCGQVAADLLRPFTVANRSALLFWKKKKSILSTAFCTHATGSRPPQHETCAHDAAAACGRMPLPAPQLIDGATTYPPTRHDRKQDTPSGTAANTSTDVSQPETCDEQTRNQKPLLQNNQECTNRNTTDTMEGPETTTITPLARDKQHVYAALFFRAYCRSAKLWGCEKRNDYFAARNQFERFRRFEFDFRRCGIFFFERFEFLVCSKFNDMQ